MVVLYALMSKGAAAAATGLKGVSGEPLRAVVCGPLTAVVGTPDVVPVVSQRVLVRHDRLMRRIAKRADPMLPARFGVALRSLAELRSLIGQHSPVFRAALRQVAGCSQMTLRLLIPRPRAARRTRSEAPGRQYLMDRLTQPHVVVPELAAVARDWATVVQVERSERQKSGAALTVYHLIRREDLGAYRRAVRTAIRALPHLQIQLSGPFPPYAFAPWL